MFAVALQRCPEFQAVIDCFADGRTFRLEVALGAHPGMQNIHHQFTPKPAVYLALSKLLLSDLPATTACSYFRFKEAHSVTL